jgi:glycosyltransferase involved in cell wall biosynthesis
VSGLRTLLVEGNPDGHRLYYISILASAASARGDKVILATTASAVGSPEWKVHMASASEELQILIQDDYSAAAISKIADEIEADHVVVPDGDAFAYQLARRRWSARGTVSALIMRERGQRSGLPGMALAATVAKAILLQIIHLQPRVQVRVLKSSSWKGISLLPFSRDPVTFLYPDTNARSYRRLLSDGSFWFGVVGNIGRRKNLPLVAAAVAGMRRADVGLVAAGQIEADALEEAQIFIERIRQIGGRVEIIDHLLEENELDQIIDEVDCVVLAHSNESPSGILGKATAAGTRIVAAGAKSLRKDCRSLGPGAQWVKLSENELRRALNEAMRVPGPDHRELASPSSFAASLLGVPRR